MSESISLFLDELHERLRFKIAVCTVENDE